MDPRPLALLAVALAACSGAPGAATTTTGDAGAPEASATADAAGAPEGAAPWAGPATHPAMPRVVDYGGPVLVGPRFLPIVFASDAIESDLGAFSAALGRSAYWAAATGEYGVGALDALPVVTVNETAAASLTDAQVRAWITARIGSGVLPAPDGRTIYAVYVPDGTVVTSGAGTSCTDFYGYHGEGTSSQGARYVYAVIPRCHDAAHSDLANLTNTTSHELAEASTNPYFGTAPAYATIDPAHAVWAIATGGSTEVGDMCALLPGAGYVQPPDLPFAVQRIWSNAAAAASHDPCVPAPAGPYVNAAPVLPDTVTVDLGAKGSITTQGVRIAVGQSRTLDVDLYSDAPTGPWKVEALDLATLEGKPAALDLKLDAASGANGDVLHLTITPLRAGTSGLEAFYVGSVLPGRSSLWVGLVATP